MTIDTAILLYGATLFIACLIAHVLLWRVRLPVHRALALFFIFFVLPPMAWSFYSLLASMGAAPSGYGPALLRGAAILLLHYALSAAYILSYPAVEALSPTLVIALYLGESGAPVPRGDLAALLPDESVLEPRIRDLVESRLVRLHGNELSLTPRGGALMSFFSLFRAFIGMRPGRG